MVQYIIEVSYAGRIRHEKLEQSLKLMGYIHELDDFSNGRRRAFGFQHVKIKQRSRGLLPVIDIGHLVRCNDAAT